MSNLLHVLLTESVKKYPLNTAVRYKNQELSYKQLNLLSEQLSSSLRDKGVKRGDRVGIYMDKSRDAIVAIFGVLKSGACYVPLDPMAPVARQLYVITDCALKYLVTSSSSRKLFHLSQMLQHNNHLRYIFIVDKDKEDCNISYTGVDIVFRDDIASSHSRPPVSSVTGSHLAYILYTSGSTGRPKGVMITHRASCAFVRWAQRCFDIKEHDRLSAYAPFHFDLSIFDIFVAIKAGATICIIPQGMSAFPQSLADFIEKERITTWYSVPSALIQLVLYGNLEKRDMSFLRQILYAGEEFPLKYLRRLIRLVPYAKYYNLYGPTETNVCTYYPIKSPSSIDNSVPIGKPIGDTEAFVVNERGKRVCKGRGELYISGSTLMNGYWNDARKTKAVLFKSPFHSDRNVKIYKTGDMVKIGRDGNYIFVGRRDNMIKSRGYRIQLEEIKLVLDEHPKVKEASVVAIPDDVIGKKIKAIVVPKKESYLTEEEIVNFCSQKLPQYMIPEIIEFRRNFPETSSGKVDCKKLI